MRSKPHQLLDGSTDLVEIDDIPTAEYGQPNRVSVDDMLHEIAHQSFAVEAALDQVDAQVRAMDDDILRATRHVYVTGCGDSYFAGIAARMAFHRFAGLPMEPVEALEMGRYVTDAMPQDSLVLAISNSGKATRTVEAASCATAAGAMTVAITGNPGSRLAHASRLILNQRIELDGYALTMPSNLDGGERRPSFGLANYLVSFTTLLLIAVRMGRLSGRLSESDESDIRDHVRRAAVTLDATVEGCADEAAAFAARFADVNELMIVGAGPAHGLAMFYGAKTYELARINGGVQHLEEWAHEQFFLTGPDSHLLVVAPRGRSSSRTREVVDTARRLGATCAVVAEAGDHSHGDVAHHLPVHGGVIEELAGIPYAVPGELVASLVARQRGHDAFEFDSELQYELNMTTIQSSRMYTRR